MFREIGGGHPQQPGPRRETSGTHSQAGERSGLPYGGLKGVWRDLMKRAGWSGVTPHALRHSFANVARDLGDAAAIRSAHCAGTLRAPLPAAIRISWTLC